MSQASRRLFSRGGWEKQKKKRENFPRLAEAFWVRVAVSYPIEVISFLLVSNEVPSVAMPPKALQLEPRLVSRTGSFE